MPDTRRSVASQPGAKQSQTTVEGDEKNRKMPLTGAHKLDQSIKTREKAFEWAASDTKAAQRGCYDGPMQTAAVEPLTLRF
jgi:hypothetical protein